MAARVVSLAGQIDHPQIGLLINRVLAMRPTEAEGCSPRQIARTSVLVAKILALVDRGCARQLLTMVHPKCELANGRFPHEVDPRDWYQAWALADLEQTAQLVERSLETAGGGAELELSPGGLKGMLDVLTTGPERQAKRLLRLNEFRSPDEEL